MIKIIYYTIFLLLIDSCSAYQKKETLEIIVSNKFLNPQKEYDVLIDDFTATDLIDSLKIIGRPIKIPSLQYKIDTLRAVKLGIQLNVLEENFKKINQLKNIDDILRQNIINESGQKIPISSICKIYKTFEYYKPNVFIPKPEIYNYKNDTVVKIEFYLKNGNRKKLIKFSKKYLNNKWNIEILD
ncbi:hypothetical protein SAMN04487910_3852 [Aquimarina amphilecti]|uniref:Uncharacterized protein n=1 Tax=Aquimarina amphilecti TaxID=1038014 RepID=A0A1H7USG0_AQUAM|nr:hypothetical protein [Aquimarina amphilecti]SEL99736.1 hypothetical protein SAMN04487910_3852 [Aquimarina amphilecti]